jgi:peptidoglycan biosynthesis protein MviN/MurJ (putative lipid II flippase)
VEVDTLESRVARAAGSPLVRGGLVIFAGIVTGNILGFFRVALTAYLLGTRSAADSLAVAIGPIDTINGALLNTIIFAFVPMMTERDQAARTALFRKISRLFVRFFVCVTVAVLLLAPLLIRLLAPGLPPDYVPQATLILRIGALSTVAVGIGAIYSALLYTDRRFAPSAFKPGDPERIHDPGRRDFVESDGRLRFRHRLHGGGMGAACDGLFRRPLAIPA